MPDWSLKPGDPLTLVISADARLGKTDYVNDHSWELDLNGGEPAALALRRELDRAEAGGSPGARHWLIGIQRHKDAPELLQALLRPGDAVRVAALPEHTSWSAEELKDALSTGMVTITPASGDLGADLAWLVPSPALPVACGSLYLVAALLPHLDAAEEASAGRRATD